jgi:hypothetical protein
MYVRREVAEQRHSSQVRLIQRGGQPGAQEPVPMDVSVVSQVNALFRQIAALRGEHLEGGPADDMEPAASYESYLATLRGKGGGKGKGQAKTEETRECYNCGKVGHLARDCRSAEKPKADGKGTDSKGKGESKGKGGAKGKSWSVSALEETADEGFTLSCLTRAPTTLNAVSAETPEVWENFERIDVMLDSGAGECVCGPQHFKGVKTTADAGRASVGVEYVTAGGERLFNFGEKAVCGQTGEGERLSILFQVTSVEKPLIAVSKLTAAGHDVWFGKDHGVVTHATTGRSMPFTKKNGVYWLPVWVPRAAADAVVSGGTRQ